MKKTKTSKKETELFIGIEGIEEDILDAKWWYDWGLKFGWSLMGFTYRHHATFYRENETFSITGSIREDIDKYIERKNNRDGRSGRFLKPLGK